MNRTFVKAGATAAILAGLMGGVAVVPSVVYADAPVVEQQAVTKDQVKAMIDKIVALRPSVTPVSWALSGADSYVTVATQDINGNKVTNYAGDLQKLETAYAGLVPGKNLTLFTDSVADTMLGTPQGDKRLQQTDKVFASWVNEGVAGNPGFATNPMGNAFNGIAKFVKPGYNPGFTRIGNTTQEVNGHAGAAAQPAYIQMDLGKTENISSFTLWRDPRDPNNRVSNAANTALVVSDDPTFKTKTVVYYSGDGTDKTDVFKLGVAPGDSYYEETASGKDLFEGKQAVSGRYVRLYLNGTQSDKGGENRIIEIAIEGKDKVDASKLYDTTAMEQEIEDAKAYLLAHEDELSTLSVQALKDAIADAEELLAKIKAGTATESLGAPGTLADKIADAQANLKFAFHVTFDDKIDSTTDTPVEVVKGEAVTMPADPVHPEGYTFAGWFLEKDGKTPFDSKAAITEDMTVYAKWTTKMGEVVEAERPTIPALPINPIVKPPVPMTPIEDIATQHAMELKPAKKKEASKKDSLPQTGDPSMLIAGASAAASVVAFAAARRRK